MQLMIGSNENSKNDSYEYYQWCQDTNSQFETLFPTTENYENIECSWIREDKDN